MAISRDLYIFLKDYSYFTVKLFKGYMTLIDIPPLSDSSFQFTAVCLSTWGRGMHGCWGMCVVAGGHAWL